MATHYYITTYLIGLSFASWYHAYAIYFMAFIDTLANNNIYISLPLILYYYIDRYTLHLLLTLPLPLIIWYFLPLITDIIYYLIFAMPAEAATVRHGAVSSPPPFLRRPPRLMAAAAGTSPAATPPPREHHHIIEITHRQQNEYLRLFHHHHNIDLPGDIDIDIDAIILVVTPLMPPGAHRHGATLHYAAVAAASCRSYYYAIDMPHYAIYFHINTTLPLIYCCSLLSFIYQDISRHTPCRHYITNTPLTLRCLILRRFHYWYLRHYWCAEHITPLIAIADYAYARCRHLRHWYATPLRHWWRHYYALDLFISLITIATLRCRYFDTNIDWYASFIYIYFLCSFFIIFLRYAPRRHAAHTLLPDSALSP